MQKKVAVVDDSADLLELCKICLEKEGYLVEAYSTFDEAVEHVEDSDICLWLLDIMLDDKSGFDLLEEIKDVHPYVPIIFMSARDKDFDRIIGLEKGSDDYITKPFNMKEMVLRVNNLIKRTYKDDLRYEVDGYNIDGVTRKVFKNEDDVALTTLEYELLMVFVQNKGKPFTREQILYKVWGNDYYGSTRVVDDTLRRLRKKMPELNIQTIYRYGYRLD